MIMKTFVKIILSDTSMDIHEKNYGGIFRKFT